MNEKYRKSVSAYLHSKYCRTSPLEFLDYESNGEIIDPSKYSVEQMVERCLELIEHHSSMDSETGIIETFPARARSSLDIWRHIKYYYPDVTIFDVMNAMYNIGEKLVGHICHDIGRRVFKLKANKSDWGLNYLDDEDEYGLTFHQWSDI